VPRTTVVAIKNFFNLAPVVDRVKNWRTALTSRWFKPNFGELKPA
jgi:hypothetical protein